MACPSFVLAPGINGSSMTQARCKIAGWATHQQKRKKWAQKEKDVDHGRPRKNEGRNHAEPQQAFDGPVCKRPSPGPQRVWAPQWFFFFSPILYLFQKPVVGCLRWLPGACYLVWLEAWIQKLMPGSCLKSLCFLPDQASVRRCVLVGVLKLI